MRGIYLLAPTCAHSPSPKAQPARPKEAARQRGRPGGAPHTTSKAGAEVQEKEKEDKGGKKEEGRLEVVFTHVSDINGGNRATNPNKSLEFQI